MERNTWVKSSKSNGTGGSNCVEVFAPSQSDTVHVRHSKRPNASRIVFARAEWEAFVAGVKNGEFDL